MRRHRSPAADASTTGRDTTHDNLAAVTLDAPSISTSRHGYVQPGHVLGSISPLAPRPAISMIKSKRKRAFVAASYYSECFVHGIRPTEADLAASEADKRYKKWWIDTTHSRREQKDTGPPAKKTKQDRSDFQNLTKPIVSDDSSVETRPIVEPSRQKKEKTFPPALARQLSLPGRSSPTQLSEAKTGVIHNLHATGGDTSHLEFQAYLKILESYYSNSGYDSRWTPGHQSKLDMDGTWLTLSKPTYSECHGRNDRGDNTYSLGRMSFDMFRPTDLVCSIQATLHSIKPVSHGRSVRYPSSIRKDNLSRTDKPQPRTYDIVVALTVEAGQTRRGESVEVKEGVGKDEFVVPRPLPCLLTNHGYCLPDPAVPNRLSIWFTGGSLEVQDEATHLSDWKQLFDQSEAPSRDIGGFARVLAARILLGAESCEDAIEDGNMKYTFKRPIGGHGQVFCDVVYADDSLRILRGHSGSLFVFTKTPDFS